MKFITFLKQTISSLAIVLFVGCNQKSEQAEIEAPIITDEVLLQLKDSADIPAISIAIFKDGNTLYNNALGVKNWDGKDSIDDNTIFEAASLTKCVAAYCALKLVEEGTLDLDKPLSDYYNYHDISHNEHYKEITARMVLSHTSGLPNWRRNRQLDTVNLRFQPGLKFSYSGEGFVYLQKVMEQITDASLTELANQMVFKPLGMDRSFMVVSDSSNYAVGHARDLSPQHKFKPQEPNAAYSLHTTATDYAKFIQELLQPKHIQAKLVNEMMTPQVWWEDSNQSMAWGLGVGLNLVDKDTLFWHWGDNGAFKAFFLASRPQQKGFVYFANSHNGIGISRRLMDLVFPEEDVMGSWTDYAQYTDLNFQLQRLYINKGLGAFLETYPNYTKAYPEEFNEQFLNQMGYMALGADNIEDAIVLFSMNVEAYPESSNVYDSLGEALFEAGDYQQAYDNYKKSVELNPNNRFGKEMMSRIKDSLGTRRN